MITVQKNILVHQYQYTDLPVIIEKIKTGGAVLKDIQHCREMVDTEQYSEEKKKIPAIIFQGKFKKREKGSLIEASGLAVVDFDHCGTELKEKLKTIPFIYVAFTSLGGNGVKALVKIPVVKNDEEYKTYFLSLEKELNSMLEVTVDASGKDICRACFFSYDPDIFVNPNAEMYTHQVTDAKPAKIGVMSKYSVNDYRKAMTALIYMRGAMEGERHTRILKASRLMGGYIAAGLISESEGIRLLEQEAYVIDPKDFQTNRRAIYDGIKNGIDEPVYEGLEKEIEAEGKYGKLYFTVADVEEGIKQKYLSGLSRGYYVGWENFDEFYTLKLGTTTYIYGAPYSGKTILWYEILINCSKFYGMKHVIFSPETGGADDIFILLIEIYSGKNFYADYGNRLTEEELKTAKDFIDAHFIVIDPEENLLSIEEFYAYCDIIERRYNIKIHTTTVDPWNELQHNFADKGNRQDIYLEWALGKIRQNARVNNRHNAIITHITSQTKIKDSEGRMYYPPADYREIAGGQSWARKGMNMISYYRPPEGMNRDGVPIPENETVIEIQKVKPKGVGKKGKCYLYYNLQRHCFYEDRDGRRFYAAPKAEVIDVLEQNFVDLPENTDDQIPF